MATENLISRLEDSIAYQLAQTSHDLSGQITREIAPLRSELDAAALAPRFPQFRLLPAEIRLYIWELALPSRVLELREVLLAQPPHGYGHPRDDELLSPPTPVGPPPPPLQNTQANFILAANASRFDLSPTTPGPKVVSNRLPPPALASVCHESRQVALHHGGGLTVTKVIEELPSLSSHYVNVMTWFDPKHDWLKVAAHGRFLSAPMPIPHDHQVAAFQHRAEQVLIRKPSDPNEMRRQVEKLASSGRFASLKRLGVIVSHDIVRPRSPPDGVTTTTGFNVEMRLFQGGDPIRFVNLNDEVDVARIASILRDACWGLASSSTTGDKTTTGSSSAASLVTPPGTPDCTNNSLAASFSTLPFASRLDWDTASVRGRGPFGSFFTPPPIITNFGTTAVSSTVHQAGTAGSNNNHYANMTTTNTTAPGTRIGRFWSARLSHWGPHPSCSPDRVVDVWTDYARHLRDGKNKLESRFLETLEANWITSKYHRFPLTVPLKNLVDSSKMMFVESSPPAREHPWVKAELARMPEIQLLHLFILEDDGADMRRLYGPNFQGRLNSVACL